MSACLLHAPILPRSQAMPEEGKAFLFLCGLRMWLISMTWFTIVRYDLGYFSGLHVVLVPNQPIFH